MRRGTGCLFDAIAILSLLIAVAVAILWARATLPEQVHAYPLRDGLGVIAIECDATMYAVDVISSGPQQAWDWLSNDSAAAAHAGAGFRFARGVYHRKPYALVGAPYWFPLALALILPAAWLAVRLRTARRHRTGTCRSCGYDLRASPGGCPECGADRPILPSASGPG